VARFLDLGFPLAALLVNCERRLAWRLMALGFLPLGLVAVLLTASRGGFLAAIVALAGTGALLLRGHFRRAVAAALIVPPFLSALWFFVPRGTLERLATIPQQLRGGDLNQRLNIWDAGWHAFTQAPFLGTGAGTFVSAAHLAPTDTAHNTMLSVAVGGGLVALFVASILVVLAARAVFETHGGLRGALLTALIVWGVTSLVATVEENRTTWLLLGVVLVAARLTKEEPANVAECFAEAVVRPSHWSTSAITIQANLQ